MLSNKRWLLIVLFLAMAVVLAACGGATPAATEVATQAPTEAPKPTEAPTQAPAFKGMDVKSPGCDKQTANPSPIDEIKATDANTVVFTLCNPDPAFLYKIALANFAVEPAAYLQKTGGTGDLIQHPIGTGPYMFTEWKHGESVTMTRFDDYWGDKAKAKTLIFRWSDEAAARLNELRAGTIDGMDNLGPGDFDAVSKDTTLQLVPRLAFNIAYLGMNNTYKPFDDVHVRKAIAMAIDRDRIVKTFYPPASTVPNYFTPCAIVNACVGDPWYKFDATAAKAELKQAADPAVQNGFKTTIFLRDKVRPYQPEPKELAQEFQAQLKANLNIDAKIEVQESGTFLENANKGKLNGLIMLGWIADYPHMTNFVDVHFGPNSLNFGKPYPDLVAAMKDAAQIADPKAAEPAYVKVNNAILANIPMVPIANGGSAVVFKADVKDAYASPLGVERFATMDPGGRDTFVWMQNGEPPGLYCGDEDDGEAIRVCDQIVEGLYQFKLGTTEVIPALATECKPDAALKVWTCALRQGVKFHDGTAMNANDVVTSWAVMWDASNPLHKGNTATWYYIDALFGIINKPAS